METHFTIDAEKAEEIADLLGWTADEVKEVCLADWPEGEQHQQWLNTAPVQEIADWIESVGT